jgi:four helix bundle protein
MDFKKLIAYQKAFQLAMEIFKISKSFPKEEKYSLTDQIRRSSRSTCANLAEAYRKRIYPKHFITKLTYSDGENSETDVWLDFAKACGYLTENQYQPLHEKRIEIGKLINYMISNPSKFGSGLPG